MSEHDRSSSGEPPGAAANTADERRPQTSDEADQGAPADQSGAPRRSASEDLADGLELVLRAARKAVRSIDPTRIEELGRRAVRGIENLDRKKVGEMGRKAAKNLDPRRIEEIAEDAGRELLNVVERVAERVEHAVSASRTERGSAPEATGPGDESQSGRGEPPAAEAVTRKVRVEPPKD